jgi:glycosyltransferase involved in cell wall biosynthesis
VNILCVEQFSKMGGGQRSLLDLLPAFLARGWQVVLGVPGPGPLADAAAALGCTIANLDCGAYSQERKPPTEMARYAIETLRLTRLIGKTIENHRIDFVYVNGPRFLPAAAWAAKRKSVPLTFHCHNRLLQKSAIVLTGESLHLCQSHIIGCCEYSVKPLRRYVPHARVQIIYNGVRQAGTVPRPNRNRLQRIGVIGRIEREKGQFDFVTAVRNIATHANDCSFVIVGSPLFGTTKYYDSVVAAASGLPVEFLGWQDDIGSALSNLDLVVVPSPSLDSLPRVIFEAFSAGVPVVAFPSGGIPEIIKDGATGYLAKEPTASSLSERILQLLNEPADSIRRVTDRANHAWQQEHTLNIYQHRVCHTLARHSNVPVHLRTQASALEFSEKGEQ